VLYFQFKKIVKDDILSELVAPAAQKPPTPFRAERPKHELASDQREIPRSTRYDRANFLPFAFQSAAHFETGNAGRKGSAIEELRYVQLAVGNLSRALMA
jgi:hypothetical protein